jgi:hypothetical protein
MPLFKSLDTSLQTLGIFAAVNKFVIANQDVTNSSTLTDSTDLQVSLIAGATYDFDTLELVGGSNVNAAGTATKLAFTGSGTFYGAPLRGHANNAEPINVSPNWPGSGTAVDAGIGWPGGGSGQSTIVSRVGRIVTTSAGTLKTQFSQWTATSGHYARLYAGSFLKVQRVS